VVRAQLAVGRKLWLMVETTSDAVGCEGCGTRAVGHGRRRLNVRDLPMADWPMVRVWAKHLWLCPDPGRAVGTWSKEVDDIAPPAALTDRKMVSICRGRGASPATMNQRIAAVRGLFEFAVVTGTCDRNPVTSAQRSSGLRPKRRGLLGHVSTGRPCGRGRLVRAQRPSPDALEPDEVAEFVSDLGSHRDRAIVLLMLLGGPRASEVRSLRLADVEWGHGECA
jgi:integrase